MKTEFDCVLCHTNHATPEITAARDLYLGVPGEWDYVRCAACGLVQQHPMPGDTSAFYASYPVHQKRPWVTRAVRRVMMPDVYYQSAEPAGAILLDYGCGNGDYLRGLGNSGLQKFGYEVDLALAARLNAVGGLTVFDDADAMRQRLAGRVDVMTLHCVLEHLPSPHIALSEAAVLLKPGGVMYAVLPHFDCWERRLFGRRWHALDAPRHLTFPDVRHLQALAAEYGLVLEKWKDVCFPNNLAGSIATAMFGRFSRAITAALLPGAWAVQRLRPSGTRAFWVRRVG